MKKLFNKKENCCGCSACAQICPKQCITMAVDAEGFWYPKIDANLCIKCGLCEKTCPLKKPLQAKENKTAYAMTHLDEAYRYACTSSGAFEIICRKFCGESPCAIFGAILDEKLQVKHEYALALEDLRKFRKSKYVQSDLGSSYQQVKAFLLAGRKVVFSGSPCQVDGLKHYLKKEWDNLLTVDFVCHGVPSPSTFSSYISYLSYSRRKKVKNVIFRNKVNVDGEWNCLGMKYIFEDGSEENDLYPPCLYMTNFLNQLYLRPSCHVCQYASMKRISDITLGDSWGMDSYKKTLSMRYTNGTSLVMLNTEKGEKIFSETDSSYEWESVPIDLLPKAQKHLVEPSKTHRCRKRFYMLSRFLSYSEAVEIATKRNRLFYYKTLLKLKLKKLFSKNKN